MNFVIFVESNTTVIMPVAYCIQTQNLHLHIHLRDTP